MASSPLNLSLMSGFFFTSQVKDLPSADSGKDTDYLREPDVVHVSWDGVFRDAESDISHYEVSLSTLPGGESAADGRMGAGMSLP